MEDPKGNLDYYDSVAVSMANCLEILINKEIEKDILDYIETKS